MVHRARGLDSGVDCPAALARPLHQMPVQYADKPAETIDDRETNMLGSIAKTYAYSRAPRTTFTVLHPKTAARLVKMKYDIRHAYAPRVAALSAVAVALPLGYLIGRRGNGRNGVEGTED